MDVDIARRFGGLERLYGVGGVQHIRDAHVAVVGIGGVGSWAVEALARSGIGHITLIDFDQVAESNINRQIHAESLTVGMAKVDAMRERIGRINPHCQVTCREEFASPENWQAMAEQGDFSAVIDACDQVKTKVALAAWTLAQKRAHSKPHASEDGGPLPSVSSMALFITVGAAGGKRRADKMEIADLCDATHDPLLAQVRYRLRREHAAPRDKRIGIACVFSTESVAPPDPSCAVEEGGGDGSLNCHG
jgi:tRNA threonylcarbamoyladenosine dehydratase